MLIVDSDHNKVYFPAVKRLLKLALVHNEMVLQYTMLIILMLTINYHIKTY